MNAGGIHLYHTIDNLNSGSNL